MSASSGNLGYGQGAVPVVVKAMMQVGPQLVLLALHLITKLVLLVTRPLGRLICRLRLHRLLLIPMPRDYLGGAGYTQAMLDSMDARWSASPNPLLRGDLRAAAERRYPPATYPELYTSAPIDLERGVLTYGHLPDGRHVSALAPRQVSRDALGKIFTAAADDSDVAWGTTIAIAFISMCIVAYSAYFGTQVVADAAISRAVAEAGARPIYIDGWSAAEAASTKDAQRQGFGLAKASGISLALIFGAAAGLLAAGAILAIGWLYLTSRLARPSLACGAVNALLNARPDLLDESKEVVRFKDRFTDVNLELAAYREQLATAARDVSPMIQIGVGTGIFTVRGSLQGISAEQPVLMSLSDLSQNLLVLGGTGGGKTYAVLQPIARQWLRIGRNRPAASPSMSLFATDGKGVLGQDIVRLAMETGTPLANVFVIGCGKDQYGVDLCDGLPPHLVAESLNSMMKQVAGAGGSSDPFWADMASRVIEASASIAYAAEVTNLGPQHAASGAGRLYSLAGIYAIATSRGPDGLAERAVMSIVEAFETDKADTACIATGGLNNAVRFLLEEFQAFPDATRGSILANVTNVLGGFTMLDALRERFGDLSAEKILDMRQPFADGAVTVVDLSPTEWGQAGRVANVMTKMRLYHAARVRNIADPRVGDKHKMLVIMDECQDLITAGSGGYSETSFLNYSRSTGLSFVMATQGIPALRAALGEGSNGQKTENLIQQMRSRIVLKVEDLDTVKYLQEMIGKTLRAYTDGPDQFESFAGRSLEERGTAVDVDLVEQVHISPSQAMQMIEDRGLGGQIGLEMNPIFQRDEHFIAARMSMTSLDGHSVDWTEKEKSVDWRAQDQALARLRHGWREEPIVHNSDMISLGRGRAMVYITRAGHTRMDIITLTPEAGKE